MHRDPAVVVMPLALRGRSPVVVPGVDVIARGAVAVAQLRKPRRCWGGYWLALRALWPRG